MMRLSLGLMSALALGACSTSNGESSSGPPTSRNYAVGAFTKIEVAGPIDVTMRTGGQPSVSARGPGNLLERIVVEVRGDTLTIRPDKRTGFNLRAGETIEFAVSAPTLRSAALAGSGDMTVDRIEGETFAGEIAGSGDLRLAAIDVRELVLGIAGSGEVTAAGQAARARYEIAGSGGIKAGQLQSDELHAGIAGSGEIEANARSTARIEIAGSGDVRVTGGAKCTVSKAGSGNVQCS